MLSPEEVKAAQARGAGTVIIPKVIEVPGLQSLVDQLQAATTANTRSQTVILAALNELTDTIKNKELKGTDMTELVKAVTNLKHEYEQPECAVDDWELTVVRDQRGMLATGTRFSAVKS